MYRPRCFWGKHKMVQEKLSDPTTGDHICIDCKKHVEHDHYRMSGGYDADMSWRRGTIVFFVTPTLLALGVFGIKCGIQTIPHFMHILGIGAAALGIFVIIGFLSALFYLLLFEQ